MRENVAAVILAAGKSTRMRELSGEAPKVLLPLHGKPMVEHLLESIEKSRVASNTVVVTGPDVDGQIRKALSAHTLIYAIQHAPLGTGHAVLCARDQIPESAKHLIVLCGDHPLFSSDTLRAIVDKHVTGVQPVTMLTLDLPDFESWRSTFAHCGRIIRSCDGSFLRIVEAKDATAEEIAVTEVNPSVYCFRLEWLWDHLQRLTPDNAQSQYYVTDVVGMSVAEGLRVETVPAEDAREAAAANTPEEFEILQRKYEELSRPGGSQAVTRKHCDALS